MGNSKRPSGPLGSSYALWKTGAGSRPATFPDTNMSGTPEQVATYNRLDAAGEFDRTAAPGSLGRPYGLRPDASIPAGSYYVDYGGAVRQAPGGGVISRAVSAEEGAARPRAEPEGPSWTTINGSGVRPRAGAPQSDDMLGFFQAVTAPVTGAARLLNEADPYRRTNPLTAFVRSPVRAAGETVLEFASASPPVKLGAQLTGELLREVGDGLTTDFRQAALTGYRPSKWGLEVGGTIRDASLALVPGLGQGSLAGRVLGALATIAAQRALTQDDSLLDIVARRLGEAERKREEERRASQVSPP